MSDSYVRQGKELVEAQRGRCIFCGRSDEPCQCGKRVHLPLGPVENPDPHWVCHICGHVGTLAHVCQGDTRTASAVPPWPDPGAYRTLRHRMDLAQARVECDDATRELHITETP
jgi:hypothetical protein